MEEKVKKILDYINDSITGLYFDVDGKVIKFSYDKKSKSYEMKTDEKEQEITLNELLVILNRPELKEPIEAKVQEIDYTKSRLEEVRSQYFAEIDALDIEEEQKNTLRLLVTQMFIPDYKVGMGNRVYVTDPELEAQREDYFEHQKEYEAARDALFEKRLKLEKKLEYATEEEAEKLQKQMEKVWDEIAKVPNCPVIISQHLRASEYGDVTLVTTLDGHVNIRNYQSMTISDMAEFIKGKEVHLDEELIKKYEGKERDED